ncbi:MAG: hypothetical protein E6G45_09890 [Actinobacteria bacterium]|nr:MAG: hypothetical protein E6G45_09890 [Actinomycetota bacterium]
MKTEDLKLDGNAIGGLLLELFGLELTAATSVCGSCGAQGYVGTLEVYVNAPGVVGRCRHCEAVMIRVVRAGNRTWLDLSGTRSLELAS